MDPPIATFFDGTIKSLWLDPVDVRTRFDLDDLRSRQRAQNDALLIGWAAVSPGSNATVIEFDFRASGGAKQKLLRRLHGNKLLRSGGFKLRHAISLEWLRDYTLAYEIVAQDCGGQLVSWDYVPSPLTA